MLKQSDMEKTIEIPEGYEARIEGNKVIPERKEGEDERIRKVLIHIVKGACDKYGIKYKGDDITEEKLLAYLERQKEQRPVEDKDAIEPTSKQDYSGLTALERAIHRGFLCAGMENVPVGIIKDTAQDCLAHIKPAEWSDVEKMHLANAILAAEKEWGVDSYTVKFLESLRPSWKPSEAQMKTLKCLPELLRNFKLDSSARMLEVLYEQLKEL